MDTSETQIQKYSLSPVKQIQKYSLSPVEGTAWILLFILAGYFYFSKILPTGVKYDKYRLV
jgi:hypothetical protein